MSELYGVDASYDTLTPDIAAALWASGKRVFAQCLWTGAETPAPAVDNLRVATAQGFVTIGYISLTSAVSGSWHVGKAKQNIPADVWAGLALRPIDIELPGINNGQISAALLVAAGRPCIYTSPSKWRDNQADTHQFSAGGVLLWLAQYDGIANRLNCDLPGGWTFDQLVGKQYTGGMQINGLEADSDVWLGDLLMEGIMDDATKARFNQEQALRALAAAALNDDMKHAVEILDVLGVLPAGTAALKPNILTPL